LWLMARSKVQGRLVNAQSEISECAKTTMQGVANTHAMSFA